MQIIKILTKFKKGNTKKMRNKLETSIYGEIDIIENPENYKEFKTKSEAEQWGRQIYGEWGRKVIEFENIKKRFIND